MGKMNLVFKVLITISVFVVLSLFQNCDSLDGFNTEATGFEDIHEGCPQGRLPNGDCIYLTPEDETRECSIENGTGLQVRAGEIWGQCAVQKCNEGYLKVGNKCEFVPVTQSCSIANGLGEQTDNGRGFESCKAVSCNTGYHVANNICVFTPISRACTIANGTGTQVNPGSGFGACTVVSCNAGYNVSNNTCVFAPITRSCAIANGTGTQTNSGSGFQACQVKSCNTGYAIQGNACSFVRLSRSCPIANGVGLQENIGSGFGTCRVQRCNTGYRNLNNACSFIPVTRACAITNGAGSQTNNGTGFSACRVQSCNAGYRIQSNTCSFIPVTRNCAIANGKGTQTNTGSGFNACRVSACNTGFRVVGNSCSSNQRACTILNGTGTQRFNITTNQWGDCTIASCNATFVANNNVGFCVKTDAPRVKVNVHVGRMDNGSGNPMWTDAFINKVIDKLNRLLKGHIVFNLNTKSNLHNTSAYNSLDQDRFGRTFLSLRRFMEITSVVSNPGTTDSAGTAIGIKYNYEPYFVMRSRKHNGSDADALEVAQIFLHELGHNMGMKHDYGGEIHMDNRYDKQPEVYVNYVKGLNACSTQSCQDRYYKVRTTSGGFLGRD